jgi:hypothetical protein
VAFPPVGTCSTAGVCDTAVTGSPIASSSYGEQITSDSSGYFTFTVEQTKITPSASTETTAPNGVPYNTEAINQYEVYGIQNGEVNLPLSNATLQVAWSNGQDLTLIGVAPTQYISPLANKKFGPAQLTAAESPPNTLPAPTLWMKGFAGTSPYGSQVTGPGEAATYNITVSNTGTVASVFFVGADGTVYQFLINPENNTNANTATPNTSSDPNTSAPPNNIYEINAGTAANGASAVTVSVDPIGMTTLNGNKVTEYSITVNGVQVAGPDWTGSSTPFSLQSPVSASALAYATSSAIGFGIQDSNSETDTVTLQGPNSVQNTVQVDVTGGVPFKLHPDSPGTLSLTPGSFGTFTINVVDKNSNPVPNAVVPIYVYDYGVSGAPHSGNPLNHLWLTAVNGVTLQQNENVSGSVYGSSISEEPTPIPLYQGGGGETGLAAVEYNAVVLPGVVSWSSSSPSELQATTNSSGQITLTVQAGNVSFWSGNGTTLLASGLPHSPYTIDVSFYKPTQNPSTPSFAIELFNAQDQTALADKYLPGNVNGSITY